MNRRTDLSGLIPIFLGAILLIALAWVPLHAPIRVAVAAIGVFIVIVFCFYNRDAAAVTLVFAIIFSPEISLFSLSSRGVVLRVDDILTIIFFVTWLLRMTYEKNLSLLRATPLNAPIFAYVAIGVLSSVFGVYRGDVALMESAFFLLKYIQYFIIFFMVANIIKTESQLKLYLFVILFVAALACAYGFFQIATGIKRISLPFEGAQLEPNTFGGYLIIIYGLVLFFALEAPELWKKLAFLAATLTVGYTVLFTYSRASYLGVAVVTLSSLFFAEPSRRFVMAALIAGALVAGPGVLPQSVKDRVMMSFTGDATVEVTPFIKLSKMDSSYMKIESARNILRAWAEHPLLGRGITGVGLVDTQYPRILGEMGLLGVLAFLWIVAKIFSCVLNAARALSGLDSEKTWRWRAMTFGYACAFIGLLAHALAANTFVIVRIMEPFWFLTAMIVALPAALRPENASAKTPAFAAAGT